MYLAIQVNDKNQEFEICSCSHLMIQKQRLPQANEPFDREALRQDKFGGSSTEQGIGKYDDDVADRRSSLHAIGLPISS